MLLKKRTDGQAKEFDFDIEGHKYLLRDVKGLSFDLTVSVYDSLAINKHFDGTKELELYKQIEDFEGEFLPFLAFDMNSISPPENINILPKNDEGEACFTLEVELRDPEKNKGLAMFLTEEDGDCEWLLPASSFNVSDTHRSFEFLIPRPEKMEEDDDGQEFGIKNQLVLRIFSWTDDLPKDYFEEKEIQHKKYEMQLVKKRQGGDWVFDPFPEKAEERQKIWESLSKGRTMLMVHGTNGNSSIAFQRFLDQKDWIEAASKHYEGRIISFNHPTLFRGVKHNAKRLKKFLNESKYPLTLDLMSRSRGGLVSRQLLEREGLPDHIKSKKLVMLAAPNQGTPASKGLNKLKVIRLNFLLEKVTKKVGTFPSKIDMNELYYQIAQVKERALNEQGKALIQGATDQAFGSEFLSELNDVSVEPTSKDQTNLRVATGPDVPKYYAITNLFDPDKMSLEGHEKLKRKLKKRLKEIFESHDNDGIVPTKGALGELNNGINSPLFNLDKSRCYVLKSSPNSHHINLLDSKEFRDKALEFLLD